MRSQITKLTSSISNFQQEKGKLPSQPIQNPQSQNSVGVLGSSEGTFEHCKVVTTLRSGKVVDKTIQTKEPTQESQSESVRDNEVSDKPYVPKTNVVDGEPEEDKATDRLKTWCEKCTPMCASARVAPSNIVYQWYGYRSTGIDVLTTENCFQMLSGYT